MFTQINKKYQLKNLYIYISWGCNLFCRHCWIENPQANNSVILPLDKIVSIILEAKNCGLQYIKITGGEPLINIEYVKKIVEIANSLDIKTSIETNGTLIDEETCLFLINKNVSISISLDSIDKNIHNFQRGDKYSFDKTINAMKLLDKYYINYTITMTTFTATDEEIDKMRNFLKNFNAKALKINIIIREGKAKQNFDYNNNSIFSVSAKRMLEIYNKYSLNVEGIKTYIMIPYAFSGFFNLLKTRKKNNMYTSCDTMHTISLLPNGDLSLCADGIRRSDILFGNINKNKITEIWNESKELNDFRYLIENSLEGVCKICKVKSLCHGGCRVIAMNQYGSINSPNPICQELYNEGLFFLNE